MTASQARPRIADLHLHYPMHLLADAAPNSKHRKLCGRPMTWLDRRRAFAMGLFGRAIDFERWSKAWRVSFDGLTAARTGLVLSVLYDPATEFLVRPFAHRPRRASFNTLICQLDCVEADLRHRNEARVVRSVADLDRALTGKQMAIAHCVEGGFHLGPDPCLVDDHVRELADRGIVYITLAHLFPRGVAADAPAIPMLSDAWYNRLFDGGGDEGLTALGRAAVRAMYKHHVLIDVAHMRADALAQTFDLLDELDKDSHADPTGFPVIATHAGHRFGKQAYMLDEETIRQIARRDGVIGLILARHQLQDGLADGEGNEHTIKTLGDHIDRIRAITGSCRHTCIGSDLDGFIKPTMSQIQTAQDLGKLDEWLHDVYPAPEADAILFDNAMRVVRQAFSLREP
jgi:microsomal dipeptidase-like Zn-dependent dipeptidase